MTDFFSGLGIGIIGTAGFISCLCGALDGILKPIPFGFFVGGMALVGVAFFIGANRFDSKRGGSAE